MADKLLRNVVGPINLSVLDRTIRLTHPEVTGCSASTSGPGTVDVIIYNGGAVTAQEASDAVVAAQNAPPPVDIRQELRDACDDAVNDATLSPKIRRTFAALRDLLSPPPPTP